MLHAASSNRRENSLVSPPATLGPFATGGSLFGEIPSVDSVKNMDEGQLRGLITNLLPAFGEARVTAAHSKLQHSLLSIETEEAAKRAAVEHEATRREVQVLQESSPGNRRSFSPRSSQTSIQRNLQLALAHCRELQQENAILEKRLHSSRRIIVRLDEENIDLKDNVHLLRQRIKENRDHLNEMQSSGAMSINNTPVLDHHILLSNRTPRTPVTVSQLPHKPEGAFGSQDPFDALIQVVNGEANSVPASPVQPKSRKFHPQHMRGAHSLSSLPTTPNKSRPVTADAFITPSSRTDNRAIFSAPGMRSTYHEGRRVQEDRESTISASDNEEEPSRENVSGSQASQTATNMLRRSLETQNGTNPATTLAPESSTLMQSKLFGQVAKPNIGATKNLKRGNDSHLSEETRRNSKRTRTLTTTAEKVGLGIRT